METSCLASGDHDMPSMELLKTSGKASQHAAEVPSEGGVKLFGVTLSHVGSRTMMASPAMMMMRKAVSMGNLSSYGSACYSTSPNAAPHPSTPENSESVEGVSAGDPHGYLSDGLVQNSRCIRERKKGVPWTEDEHRMFLVGLEKLGKGDWRGISRNFVPTRTPTQVASHAQKHFLRQSSLNKRKRRSSLFDMTTPSPFSTPDQAGVLRMELNLGNPTVSADPGFGMQLDGSSHREQLLASQTWCNKFSLGIHLPTNLKENEQLPLSSNCFREIPACKESNELVTFMPPLTESSSSSMLSPLCRIDENVELSSSLTLSIGPPPISQTRTELAPKVEQQKQTRHAPPIGDNSNALISNPIRVV
ncbi:hypothetical protein KP509_15G045900 [Ceratopteris richardii]|uniref:Uncharacterized protein n=1 Tax=Ceratopteris richardii TaxID=49495 RepID=A0A8T2T6L0_CERRI|nr:hypothetical protein KP509_15G045900 [Ceratopteris richardii]